MTAILLAAALALPARADGPSASAEREVRAVFVKVDQLLARQAGMDARTVAGLDAQIESLSPAVLHWRWRAVAPLADILEDQDRPLKARLFALAFLGLTHDPAAFPVLKDVLLDPREPEALRSAAAADVASLGVSPQALRQALCAALAQETLPDSVALAALPDAARLGCDETAVLEGWARRGSSLLPEPASARAAELAVAGLSRSRPIEASRALVRLLDYFPVGSDLKLAALHGLWRKRADLPAIRKEAAMALKRTVWAESGHPATLSAAVPLLAALGSADSVPLLRKLLEHPDAEVVAASAEALAELQFFPARDDIAAILAHVRDDPRFAPAAGRPDPLAVITRLQAAQRRLK